MENLIITNWNEVDSASFYTYQSTHHPLIYSNTHNLWVANSYACCKSILNSEDTKVPQPVKSELLNERATLMLDRLVRINNGEQHHHARIVAVLLYEQINDIDLAKLFDFLLADVNHSQFDWVSVIGKRLSVYAIAKGLQFSDLDCDWIVRHMPQLNKIMLPVKTSENIGEINSVIEHYYALAANYITNGTLTNQLATKLINLSKEELTDLLICNLLGLFIQSYDACRALLTISAKTLARLNTERITIKSDNIFYQKLINELLRIDPPVHNTRRIAIQDIYFGEQLIRSGQTILIVMGAANMDHMVFHTPEHFDMERGNNAANLTFGLGGHSCIAKYFCTNMAIAACRYLVDKFGGMSILPQEIIYESQLNVKMAKELLVSL